MGVFSVQAEEMALTNWADNFEFDGARIAWRAGQVKRPPSSAHRGDYTRRSPFQWLPATMRKEKANKGEAP